MEKPQVETILVTQNAHDQLDGGFKYCLFSSLFGEMIQFD